MLKSHLLLLDSLGESDCEPCYDEIKSLFEGLKKDEFRFLIKPLIQKEMTCNQPNEEDNDDLCDAQDENVDGILKYIADNVVFTDTVAKEICDVIPGACE